MSPISHIYYINLDHRLDRLQEIRAEISKMGFPPDAYERIPAIYHREIGGVGCARSHIKTLEDAWEKGYEQILVLEDDFQMCVSPETWMEAFDVLQNTTLEYDVCLISYQLMESTELDDEFAKYFRRVLEAQTTSGYIIKRHYIPTLIHTFREAADAFERTNYHWLYAIDVAWKTLQRNDKWICFYPRLGKQRPSYSDCGNTYSEVDW